jgi:hypothetical protein
MAVIICPSCGGKVSTTRSTCFHCGHEFEAKKTCPECEEKVDANASECPVCGYVFNDSEENITTSVEKETKKETKAEQTDDVSYKNGFLYAINNEDATYNITGVSYTVLKDYVDICIPSEINGRTVTGIDANAFADCTWITSITIPNTVTSIGYRAFEGCTKLVRISIPASVTVIGESAFYKCENITEVHIPTIDDWRKIKFYNYFSNPLYKGAWLELDDGFATELVIPEGDTHIGAFNGCCSLTSITLPDSITHIGVSEFSCCKNLTSIKMGNGVSIIANEAFFGCEKLSNITIPDSVTSIGERAFMYCKSLAEVTMGAGVTNVGKSAFEYCSNIKTVHTKNLAAWCSISFAPGGNPTCRSKGLCVNGELITDLVVPDGVTNIGNRAFNQCKSLTSVIIPDSVTGIGECAFQGCNNLTSVTMPTSVTNIHKDAFYGCENISGGIHKRSVSKQKGQNQAVLSTINLILTILTFITFAVGIVFLCTARIRVDFEQYAYGESHWITCNYIEAIFDDWDVSPLCLLTTIGAIITAVALFVKMKAEIKHTQDDNKMIITDLLTLLVSAVPIVFSALTVDNYVNDGSLLFLILSSSSGVLIIMHLLLLLIKKLVRNRQEN